MSKPAANIRVKVDPTNPGQFFACCGLMEIADRLAPGAEAWYETHDFCIAAKQTLREVLAAAKQTKFCDDGQGTDADNEEEADVEDTFCPLVMESPFYFRLDWWQDKGLKTWAGSMSASKIALAMCGAINQEESDPLNQAQVVYDPTAPLEATAKKPRKQGTPREPFQFDSRRGANALGLDVGFIPDSLKKKWKVFMWTHPAVEFLCLIGLQRCRPAPTKSARVFDYFTWTAPCSAAVLPAAVNGLLGDAEARAYRFKNIFRTGQKKHKAFTTAVPLLTGDFQ